MTAVKVRIFFRYRQNPFRKQHAGHEGLFYFLTNFSMIKSRRTKWVGRVASIWKREILTGFWWGSLKERDNILDLGVDGRIILK